MFQKNQKVQIQPHNRTRHIYQNSSASPGKVTPHKGGKVGTIVDVLEDFGDVSYVVETPGKTSLGNDFREYSADELAIV